MDPKRTIATCILVLVLVVVGHAQGPAALEKLRERYTEDQLNELRENTHYKYVGLLLFYDSSFKVLENGTYRAATENEIALVDLHQYDGMRRPNENILVDDAQLGKGILLLGRAQFRSVVLARSDAADRAAFLAYEAAAQKNPELKLP
ncbi:MAG: hypothetical protein IPP83_03700 [Flavobacteriales bacterium]|nr:hypothetical protein [Flavobacteriales bacterium]